jgi:hypothetical protein
MIIEPTHDCFTDALEYLEGIAQREPVHFLLQHRLVHGVCLMPEVDNKPFAHAWVEHGDDAIGAGICNGHRVYYVTRRRDYYRHFRPQMMTKYTVIQAWQENKRTYHYGPWEDYYRRMITDGNED